MLEIVKGITIATFISNNEVENKKLYQFTEFLNKHLKIELIIFSDYEIQCKYGKNLVTPKMTKYQRINKLLKEAKFNDILCIDNDITPNDFLILEFINKCLKIDYGIAWGKIKAENIKGLVPRLINVDKNLSHNYIRPILWNLNIGISLPGQIFMINKKYFENTLPKVDTVYDDLMIGATARENKYPVFFVKSSLGYEKPKENLIDLLRQRIRWAKGLAETIMQNKRKSVFKYILLHGFAFNLLWIPFYSILLILIKINVFIGIFFLVTILFFLSDKDIKNMIWSFIYIIIFPIVYIVWIVSLIYNLVELSEKDTSKNV